MLRIEWNFVRTFFTSFPRTAFWKILEIQKFNFKKLFLCQFGLEKNWLMFANVLEYNFIYSSAQTRMKLYAHLPYIIPKNYFLGNSEKNDRKNSFFSKLELRKNSFMSQKILYTFCSTSHVKTFLASFHRTVFWKKPENTQIFHGNILW